MNTFIPSDTNCSVMNCNNTDLSEPIPYQDIHVFYPDKGSEDGTLYFKKCSKCTAIYYYNFTLLSNGKRISSFKADNDVVLWFANVGYDKRLMHQLDSDILHKHSGFSNFASAYNYFCETTNIVNRKPMDRVHLEKTWFFWRLTHYFEGEHINLATPASFEFHAALMNLREVCRTVFIKRWNRQNHSQYCIKDCSQLLVLDGHQKATRRVCSVKELTSPSRELGTVKVGCPHTPKRGEKNCIEHIFSQVPPIIPSVRKMRKRYNLRRRKARETTTRFLTCRTLKAKNQKRFLHRTSGIIAAVYNCGYICALQELYGSESKIKVNLIQKLNGNTIVHDGTAVVIHQKGTYHTINDTFMVVYSRPVTQYMCHSLSLELIEGLEACLDYRRQLLNDSKNTFHHNMNDMLKAQTYTRNRRALFGIGFGLGVLTGGIVGTIVDRIGNQKLTGRIQQLEEIAEQHRKMFISTRALIMDISQSMLNVVTRLSTDVNELRQSIYNAFSTVLRIRQDINQMAILNIQRELKNDYKALSKSLERIHENELNLDFLDVHDEAVMSEFIYSKIKHLIPGKTHSIATLVSSMLIHQKVTFEPAKSSELNETFPDIFTIVTEGSDGTFSSENMNFSGILPKFIGNIVIKTFVSSPSSIINRLYSVTPIPYFVTESSAVEVVDLPKLIAFGDNGTYTEWTNYPSREECFIGQNSYCRIPPIEFDEIKNKCIRGILEWNETEYCYIEQKKIYSPLSINIEKNVWVVSTFKNITCRQSNNKNTLFDLSVQKIGIIHTNCRQEFVCTHHTYKGGSLCNDTPTYLLEVKRTEKLIPLGKSIHEIETELTKLSYAFNNSDLMRQIEKTLNTARLQKLSLTAIVKASPALYITLTIILIALIIILVILVVVACMNSKKFLNVLVKNDKKMSQVVNQKREEKLSDPMYKYTKGRDDRGSFVFEDELLYAVV
ncbi:unnamed protein product [Didymodactylos carnosus]|uniref:CxC5 like cysteine cluster associated with KDZ domain-containing protein n=1 Tax=Didymodactylos carnosus TaxID=1234261 RepID=A0A8S2IDA0_9BILA|nr:unnamed protein product [Didymodactylos carnosus]CAF3738090.1 unnamed protein product [Didymodactylos carnosus]